MKQIASGPAPGPMAQNSIDPYSVVKQNLHGLQSYYKNREDELRSYKLDPEAHNKAIAGLQEEYDQAKFKITSLQSQLDTIKRGMSSGQINPTLGQEAMMRLVVPPETADAMFPRIKEPTVGVGGTSPTGLTAHIKRFDTIREGILDYPGGKRWWRWDTQQADREKMIKSYFNEWNIANLNDRRNAAKIPGFNQAFIESMGKDERTKNLLIELLDSETGDPRMLAAFSPDSGIKRGFMNQFGVTKNKPLITPFSQGIQKQAPKQTNQRIRVVSPQGVTGTVEARELEQYISQGFKRIQ